MRIAFVSDLRTAPWGGSEELWSRAARRLIESGGAVSACLVRRREPVRQLEELTAAGCRIHWIDRPTLLRRAVRKLLRGRDHDPMRKWLRASRPDLVVNTLSSSAAEADVSLACAEYGIPYVLVVQNAAECHWPGDRDLESIVPAFRKARRCFFVSQGNRRLTERQLGVALPHAEVVWNPFNVRYDADPAWPEHAGGFRLACVARLDPASKGQDLIFQVLAQDKWRERPVTVSLYGTGHNDQSLRRLASEYYGLNNVVFQGHVGDIERVWAENHALLMPSRYEGLPLAVIEAMLCRRVCIVTAVAGNPEVVEDNRTGFLAAAPTPDCLDEAMERAWQRREEWRSMGAEAGEAVRQRVPADPVGAFGTRLRELFTAVRPGEGIAPTTRNRIG